MRQRRQQVVAKAARTLHAKSLLTAVQRFVTVVAVRRLQEELPIVAIVEMIVTGIILEEIVQRVAAHFAHVQRLAADVVHGGGESQQPSPAAAADRAFQEGAATITGLATIILIFQHSCELIIFIWIVMGCLSMM